MITKKLHGATLNFTRAASLGFMTSYDCRYCQEQRYDAMESKMAARRKFITENMR